MNPTLKAGDVLHLSRYAEEAIREGDVIVFKRDSSANAVTHRVVSTDCARVQTRGDNNDATDPWIISRDQVVGRIDSVTREGRTRRLYGGLPGRLYTRILRLRRSVRRSLFRKLQPAYRRVAAWGVFQWAARSLETRIVYFRRSGMPPELHLLLAGRVIGRLLPGEKGWRIKPPFRLVINEDLLPGNQTERESRGHRN
jgi:signal peptidase I